MQSKAQRILHIEYELNGLCSNCVIYGDAGLSVLGETTTTTITSIYHGDGRHPALEGRRGTINSATIASSILLIRSLI